MTNEPRERPFVLRWRSAVLNSSLSATQKLCLLVLAEWADPDGTNCRPAMETIADKASVNEKSVRRAMDAAAPLGWFARHHRRSNKGWKQFEYTLSIPDAADSVSCRSVDVPDIESTPSEPSTGLSVLMQRTLCPDVPDTESDDLSITYPRPSKEQKHVQSELIAPVGSRFDEFWKAYPRKVNKADAQKAWKTKKLDSIAETIIAAVVARVADPGQWSDPQYIPHPTTYLNGARWEDEWNPSAQPTLTGIVPRESDADAARINAASMVRLGIAA